jgi:hypothetical protein
MNLKKIYPCSPITDKCLLSSSLKLIGSFLFNKKSFSSQMLYFHLAKHHQKHFFTSVSMTYTSSIWFKMHRIITTINKNNLLDFDTVTKCHLLFRVGCTVMNQIQQCETNTEDLLGILFFLSWLMTIKSTLSNPRVPYIL